MGIYFVDIWLDDVVVSSKLLKDRTTVKFFTRSEEQETLVTSSSFSAILQEGITDQTCYFHAVNAVSRSQKDLIKFGLGGFFIIR